MQIDKQKRALRLDGLSKSYGNTLAVEDLSLEVHPGEIVGLIGPDGAGKTTSMRIACGLLVPLKGKAEVMGFDSTHQTRRVKDHLGYMPQRFSLYPDLSVDENIRFFADLFLVGKTERIEREKRLMEFSRLGPFRDRKAGALSGGMKQKLALCCTLIHTPSVLILDEPTFGVDPVSRQEFWAILKDLVAGGMAILVSTPYMDEAGMCDRIVLMHKGRMMASGTPDEVSNLFPKRLLEVTGADLVKARGELIKKLKDVEVIRFGDRLHVVYGRNEEQERIRDVLRGMDLKIEPVPPTIEDTFVSMMKEGAAPAEAA